ncbi:YhgE/Pip domain-containing protein [Bifidobacterium leontopitheci]|uniref:ABC transporter n=1 Tax=Bifidobacterium leontopitheci TaxID=2650774 RepID=A0A6I1GN88_9BIFI|nr:ABC transporter [Bifidobacterium leontopitheci]
MRTIWRIFTRDLLRILRNPVAVVVTLGVAVIPSLYAWFNILANWDPYSSTGNLQVAVANEDRGVDSDLVGHLDAGKQVVKELKKNTALGWRFVDAGDAVEGVQSGDYYAAIVLPKDFSESLVDSVTGSSKRPAIQYYVNEKKNAIAPKITDTGATTIDSQINETFVSTVSKTLADTITKEGGKIDAQATATRDDVVRDLNGTVSQLESVSKSLGGMQSTFKTAESTVEQTRAVVTRLKRQIADAQKASGQTQTLLEQTQRNVQSFSSQLSGAFDDGSVTLSGIGVQVNSAAGTAVSAFNTAQGSVDDVTNALQQPISAAGTLVADLKDVLTNAGIDESTAIGKRIWQQVNALDKTVQTQQTQLDTFHSESSQFISDGKTAATGLAQATGTATSGGIGMLNRARTTLTGTITPNLTAGLDSFASLSGTMSGTLVALSGTLDQSDALFDQLTDTLRQASTTVAGTQRSIGTLTSDIRQVRTDVAALGSSAVYQKIRKALNINTDQVGEFMGAPVTLATKTVYPMDNYGSAVTPFYTNLALWVGGFVLIAIYKLEVDRERPGRRKRAAASAVAGSAASPNTAAAGATDDFAEMTATQAYLGRWLLFVMVGQLQALIVMVGNLVLGIQCEHPVLFVLAGLFCSFVYVNIIYALAVAFRHIGKAVAVILVIVQIPGASGLYPIEMMPDFFRELHPWLPFTYGINAMRGPIAGTYGNHYWLDMGHLAMYLPVALFIGLVVRRYAMNLNALFDRRLAETDLMVTERNAMINERISFSALLNAFPDTAEMREVIRQRAHRFFCRYPRLIRGGLAVLVVLPFIFLVLLFVIPNKVAMLTGWILSIIIIDTFLIVVEYLRDRYARQLGVSAMSADEFRDAVLHGYQHRHTTFRAPSRRRKGGAAGDVAAGDVVAVDVRPRGDMEDLPADAGTIAAVNAALAADGAAAMSGGAASPADTANAKPKKSSAKAAQSAKSATHGKPANAASAAKAARPAARPQSAQSKSAATAKSVNADAAPRTAQPKSAQPKSAQPGTAQAAQPDAKPRRQQQRSQQQQARRKPAEQDAAAVTSPAATSPITSSSATSSSTTSSSTTSSQRRSSAAATAATNGAAKSANAAKSTASAAKSPVKRASRKKSTGGKKNGKKNGGRSGKTR